MKLILTLSLHAAASFHGSQDSFPTSPNLALATAGIIIETHENTQTTIALYRRFIPNQKGEPVANWDAAVQHGKDVDWVTISGNSCPALSRHAAALGEMNSGAFVRLTPDSRAPTITLGAPLFTVWGRARQESGGSQVNRVTTASGPFADWAREMQGIITSCQSAPSVQ